MEFKRGPVIEYDKMVGKYHLTVFFLSGGYRCGYLGMPYEEWEESVSNNDFYFEDLNVHGGVTFGYDYPGFIDNGKDGYGYIGFDCNHIGDAKDFDKIKEYGFPMKEIYEEDFPSIFPATVKDLDFVLAQLRVLVEQHRDSNGEIFKYCDGDIELYANIIYKNYKRIKEKDKLFLKLINKY